MYILNIINNAVYKVQNVGKQKFHFINYRSLQKVLNNFYESITFMHKMYKC